MHPPMIHYRIDLRDAASHRFHVTLTVPAPGSRCHVSLPVWIPGSYMVREFSRHISAMRAVQAGRACTLRALDKCSWQVDGLAEDAGPLCLHYEVYAFDSSVRTAWLDDGRGFFNPTSLCPRVLGREDHPHQITLTGLPAGWQVATAMPSAPDGSAHCFVSAHYDELVDHPFELGAFWRGSFEAGGVVHECVVSGAWPGFDGERLLADSQKICAAQIAFWHGADQPPSRPPFDRYVFLLHAVEDGYGGLEHRASTALIAKRADLPRQGATDLNDGYLRLLGLISHEYFHTWNVKRLTPKEFLKFDYSRENHTELLWFFEGFTSYYDDLFLLRAGLIDPPRYLKLLATTVNLALGSPGRQVHSVAQASFEAWIKYYRPDENSPNATVSYYTQGALIGLLLDLRLRQAGQSLDLLMQRLWQQHHATGLAEADVLAQVQALAGAALAQDLAGWVHGTGELPLAEALIACGVATERDAAGWAASLGLKLAENPASGVQVKTVLRGSAAEQAGLSVGDELLAINGWRLRRFEEARQWLLPGQPLQLLVCRQQRLRELSLTPPAADAPLGHSLSLRPDTQASAQAQAHRQAWLG